MLILESRGPGFKRRDSDSSYTLKLMSQTGMPALSDRHPADHAVSTPTPMMNHEIYNNLHCGPVLGYCWTLVIRFT